MLKKEGFLLKFKYTELAFKTNPTIKSGIVLG